MNGRLHFARFLLLLLALTLPFTRIFSGVNLVVLAALFFFYLLYTRKIGIIPRSLLAFSAWGLLYTVLSFFTVLPQSWTRLFEISAIPQQALFAYAIPTTFGILLIYLRGYLKTTKGRILAAKQLMWIWIAWKIPGFFISDEKRSFIEWLSIAGMGNTSALIIVAACLYLSTVTSDFKKYFTLSIFLILSAFSPFSQNLVYAFLFTLIWLLPRQAVLVTAGFIASSVLLYMVFFNDPFALSSLDGNMPIRLILIRDALAGLVQSYGLGVGFGTESITNDYGRWGVSHFQSSEEPGFIHLAAHNSFATIPFRLGVVGFILLIWFCAKTFRQIQSSASDRDTQAKCALFLAFFTVTFTNPGLESFVYLYGICLYLSTLWALGGARPTFSIES